MVKLSIVTINYNNYNGLSNTFTSVFDQSVIGFEYIVIDGGSTDGSKELIEQYSDKLSYWVAERDNGIYEAMNKGIKQATGEYLLMLNSGDCLSDNQAVSRCFDIIDNNTTDFLFFNILWKTDMGMIEHNGYPELTYRFFRNGSVSHQSTLIRRELHNVVGLYDESLRIASDWKFFMLSICRYNASHKSFNTCISLCERNGISWSAQFQDKIREEKAIVYKEFFAAFESDYQQLKAFENFFSKLRRTYGYRLLRKMRVTKLLQLDI